MSTQKLRHVRAIGSQPHLDNGLAADLDEPLLQTRFVLLAIQDVADLIAGLRELLARQGLLGVELEDMVPDLRPEGRRMLAGGQAQHGLLDVGCELAALENAQTPAVLGGSGILGARAGALPAVLSRRYPPPHVLP